MGKPATDWKIGEQCNVRAFGRYYNGQVIHKTAVRITVEFWTCNGKTQHTRTVNPSKPWCGVWMLDEKREEEEVQT